MLAIIIQLVIVALVLGLVCWLVTKVPFFAPFAQIIQVVAVVLFIIYILYILLNFVTGHGALMTK